MTYMYKIKFFLKKKQANKQTNKQKRKEIKKERKIGFVNGVSV